MNFSAKLPADNIYGLDEGPAFDPSVDAGYYAGNTVYSPGKFLLELKGVIDGANVDVTYNLTVKNTPF